METQTNYSLLGRYSDGMKDCTSVKFPPCDLDQPERAGNTK